MSKITKVLCGAGIAMAASLSFNTMAADGAALYNKLCQTCHGAEGKAPIMPQYPKLTAKIKSTY